MRREPSDPNRRGRGPSDPNRRGGEPSDPNRGGGEPRDPNRGGGGPSDPDSPVRAPAVFRWALAIFAVQAVLVWLYVGFLGYSDLTRPAGDPRRAALVTIYFGGYALAFAAVGWALRRRRSWARAPAIVLQLLLAALGYVMIGAGAAAIGVPVLALALLGAGLLLAPASRETLTSRRGPVH